MAGVRTGTVAQAVRTTMKGSVAASFTVERV
jgi:hypothetical protein